MRRIPFLSVCALLVTAAAAAPPVRDPGLATLPGSPSAGPAAAPGTEAPASETEPPPELLAFGAIGPDIAGPVLNGPAGTRLSQFKGKVIAVDFWATWCTPCLQSVPELNRVRNELRAEGWADRFEVVSVDVDSEMDKGRRFLEIHPVDYPVIGDPLGIAMKRYGPWKLPATFLLTPEGKVHMIWLGYAGYFADDIKKIALEVLKQGGPPGPAKGPTAAP